ncbi:hypothetical protein BKA63DRAFT_316838 [Paraphoma chrysanthemicola]|nr:hypothetical protein BKA63DRAFT_316838 [Paraphoma chrysanthemicola]
MHTKNDATTVETTHPYGARASRSRILIWVPKKHFTNIWKYLFSLVEFTFPVSCCITCGDVALCAGLDTFSPSSSLHSSCLDNLRFSNKTAHFDHGYDHGSTSAFTPMLMHMNALPTHDGLVSILGKSSDMVFKASTMVSSRQSTTKCRSSPQRHYTRCMSFLDTSEVHAGGAGSLLWRWTYRVVDGPVDKPSIGVSHSSSACFHALRSCLFSSSFIVCDIFGIGWKEVGMGAVCFAVSVYCNLRLIYEVPLRYLFQHHTWVQKVLRSLQTRC